MKTKHFADKDEKPWCNIATDLAVNEMIYKRSPPVIPMGDDFSRLSADGWGEREKTTTMKSKITEQLDKVYSNKKNQPTPRYMKGLKRVQARALKKPGSISCLAEFTHEGSVSCCSHRVTYYFHCPKEPDDELAKELDEHAEARAREMIGQDYNSGELNYEIDNINCRGWWQIE